MNKYVFITLRVCNLNIIFYSFESEEIPHIKYQKLREKKKILNNFV